MALTPKITKIIGKKKKVCVFIIHTKFYNRIWMPRLQQHMSFRSSRLFTAEAEMRWVSWWKACSICVGGRACRAKAVWRAPSSLSTDPMVGASPPAGLGSEPERFLDVTSFTVDADRPGMVSLSSRAGTMQGKQAVREKGGVEGRAQASPVSLHP